MLENLNIREVIRTGVVFEIHRAVDPATGKQYAVKMMRKSSLGNSKHMQMLKNEWGAVRKLEHKNVIKYYAIGKRNGQPYIVMEWLEGENLKFWAEKNLPSGIMEVDRQKMFLLRTQLERIILDLIESIAYIHTKGVYHLDIKPENFYMLEDKSLKLIDFSNSRHGFWGKVKRITTIDGSPSFISPEQIRKTKPDETSDIYSLGATIYYLVTGKPPYTGLSVDQILTKHLKEKHTPIRDEVPIIRLEPAKMIDKMLAKTKETRLINLSMLRSEIAKSGLFPKLD